MSYEIQLSTLALEHIRSYKNSGNKILLRKTATLLEELKEHPRTGTGKPEQLKHNLSGLWSRHIDQKNRLVYTIEENILTVHIISAKGHYRNK